MTIAWLAAGIPVVQAAEAEPAGTLTTLDNGMSLVVVPKDTAPGVVAWQLWMDVGSGDEVETGRTGFAHFFEHLMFHGSEAIPAEARASELLRLGVEENAWTWLDDTVYHAVLPATSLSRYAELEADRFISLHLTPDGVRREAGAVYGEFRKGQADPETVLEQRMMAQAFRVHPYGHDTLGLLDDIEAMPDAHADAVAFHDRTYRPGNATLVVVGDVDPDAVRALVQRTFGSWAPGTAEGPVVPAEPPQLELRRADVEWPGPTAPILCMMWRIPAHGPDTLAESASLELLGQLLLAPTGRLKERLVREEGLAYSVDGGSWATRDPGVFRVQVVVRDVADLERAEQIVREEVAALQSGVDEDALSRVRDHVVARRLLSSDDPTTIANRLGEARIPGSGGDPQVAYRQFQEQLLATSTDAVQQAASSWLVDTGLTLGVLRPAAEPPEAE